MRVGLSALAVVAMAASPARQGPNVYTLIASDGRRVLPVRQSGTADLVALDALASLFNFTVREDTLAGGLTITTRGQRIVLTPGQSLASVGGRVVSLGGPVSRAGSEWFVPVDFLSRALGPATNTPIDVRHGSRLIIVGNVRVPQISGHFARQGVNGRLTLDVEPGTPVHVTRDGSRLVIKFDADALDANPIAGFVPELAQAAHVDGTSLIVDLGPLAAAIRAADTGDPTRVVVDVLAPAPGGAPAAPRTPAPTIQEPPPVAEPGRSGGVRTVVIDPGHGGDDAGVRSAGGTAEKDLTLQIARRLKAALESRIGVRVLLTRDGDSTVSIDQRSALANNSKADLLLSLHANASFRPAARGAQVLSLNPDDYKERARGIGAGRAGVPVIGGGTRFIEAVPWDLAQIPYAARSAALQAVLVRHLGEQHVPLYVRASDRAPLRILAAANMPALLVEVGFLSNADDEHALTGDDLQTAIVNALVATVADARGDAGAPAARPPRVP